jgi:hypothetical protein
LNGGASRGAVAAGIASSDEAKAVNDFTVSAFVTDVVQADHLGEVVRLYDAALDRDPDLPGAEGWLDQLDAGASLEAVAAAFIGSSEFEAKFGTLDNTAFVTQIFNNALDRAPDAGGLAAWVGALNGGASRASVLVGIAESAENKAQGELQTLLDGPLDFYNDTLRGSAGNDLLFGGRGADTYEFGNLWGSDTVFDFEDNVDTLDFSAVTGLDAIGQLAISQAGSSVEIAFDNQKVTLLNTQLSQINADDLFFGSTSAT